MKFETGSKPSGIDEGGTGYRISKESRLPPPGFPNLKIVVTSQFGTNYRNQGREDFIERIARTGHHIAAVVSPKCYDD